ncbi:hypothetical protein Agub_g9733 [Astrephomene gubernaculifera]|uniref:Uncharacterized protein n=1 Tax=Astrephomene gubernaculifera TaxID=47775 RepID=A0AAD3HPI5_9CHLO|nr:hypothetical protein Agub_g9733 [Astrephomene gubernaculifera]
MFRNILQSLSLRVPWAIAVCSLVAAVHPHFIAVGTGLFVRTGVTELEESLRFLGTGAWLTLLGYYCSQFVPALSEPRQAYLLALSALTFTQQLVMGAGVAVYGTRYSSILAVKFTACLLLLFHDPALREEKVLPVQQPQLQQPQQQSTRAKWVLGVCTHGLWLLYALFFTLLHASPDDELVWPYGVAAALTYTVAVARLGMFIRARYVEARATRD